MEKRVIWGQSSDRGDGIAIDFGGNGALEQLDADDDLPGLAEFDENALDATQRAGRDEDFLAEFEEGPGFDGETGTNHGLDGGDFASGNGRGRAADKPPSRRF